MPDKTTLAYPSGGPLSAKTLTRAEFQHEFLLKFFQTLLEYVFLGQAVNFLAVGTFSGFRPDVVTDRTRFADCKLALKTKKLFLD